MYHSNNDITLLKNSLPGWMGHNKSKLCVCVCVSLKPSSQKVEQVHELGERDTWWNLPVLPITWLTDEAEGSLMEAETRATRLVATGDLQKATSPGRRFRLARGERKELVSGFAFDQRPKGFEGLLVNWGLTT